MLTNQAKKRKISDQSQPEYAIIAFTNLPGHITKADIAYSIQKDYNIEGYFFDPNFLELSMFYIQSIHSVHKNR